MTLPITWVGTPEFFTKIKLNFSYWESIFILLVMWLIQFVLYSLLLSQCLSYFPISVTKHCNQINIYKKMFNWPYGSRGSESVMAEQRHGDTINFTYRFQVGGSRNTPGMFQVFWNHKSQPQWHTYPNEAIPANPSQRAASTEDQI